MFSRVFFLLLSFDIPADGDCNVCKITWSLLRIYIQYDFVVEKIDNQEQLVLKLYLKYEKGVMNNAQLAHGSTPEIVLHRLLNHRISIYVSVQLQRYTTTPNQFTLQHISRHSNHCHYHCPSSWQQRLLHHSLALTS